MNKIFGILIVGILITIGIWYVLVGMADKSAEQNHEMTLSNSSPLNTTYLIEGEEFRLVNGSIEKETAPNSATKNKVAVFGEPAFGDVDGDGDADAVVILTSDAGGSGNFYYVAMAANIDGKYMGTDTILLGDRISVEEFYIEDRRAKISYKDRKPGEAMIAEPSVEKNKHLQFDPESLRLIEVAVDFEGEADPELMTLDMKTWTWVRTVYNDDTEIVPKEAQAFTLTFKEDGTFSATTDCNSVNGSYEVNDSQITFGRMAMTRMFCEGSQEQDFSATLSEAQSFFFTNKGELIFDLKFDSGSATFR